MKKTIFVGLLMVALSLPSIGWAATVGNIAETQGALGKFSLGLEYDGVFDRDMDWDSGSMTIIGQQVESFPAQGDSVEDIEIDSNRVFVKGTLGLHPNVDIFVKLGMAGANWEAKYKETGAPDEKIEFEDDWDFAWGIGAKVKIFETQGGLRFLGDAQYLAYKVEGDVKLAGEKIPFADSETEIEEWQVALYVNQTFGNFSPYAGVKYSDLEMDWELDLAGILKIKGEAEADDNFGIFLGTDIYVISDLLSINIEARFIDETAGTLGLTYSF